MDDTKTKQLLEKFKKLPETMKEAIVSTDIDNAVFDIAKKHGLLLPEAGQLDNEIVLVLIGEKQASDFIKNIENEIGLSKEKALAVGKDVNEMIFEKVRAKMKSSKKEEGSDPEMGQKKVEVKSQPPKSSPTPLEKTSPEKSEEKKRPSSGPSTPEDKSPSPELEKKTPSATPTEEQKKEDASSISPEPKRESSGLEKKSVETKEGGASEIPTSGEVSASIPKTDRGKSFLKENLKKEGQSAEKKSPENIMEQKLSQPVKSPAKETEKEMPGEKSEEEKKKPEAGRKIDPYREPIEKEEE